MRRLIVNADDFGLVEATNRATIDAHRAGSVTSATLIVNGEAVEEAARLAHANPTLGVGLHFNLTYGLPTSSAVRCLVDSEGRFVARRELLRRAWSRTLRAEEIERELQAQLRALSELGIQPTHVDGHQHVQVIPMISAVVGVVAANLGLPVRVPRRQWTLTPGTSRLPQRLALASLCLLAQRAGLRPATAAFASVFDLGAPTPVNGAAYLRLIRRSRGETIELMVHPALSSKRLSEIHPDLYQIALSEATALSDPGLASQFRAAGCTLVNFRDLGRLSN